MLYAGGIDAPWLKVVNPDCDEQFAWSPDSRQIAFAVISGEPHGEGFLRSKLRSTEVAICGIDGSQEDFVLEQPGILVVLDWSPDGKRLLLGRRYFDVAPQRPSDILEFDLVEAQKARARDPANEGPLRGSRWAATHAAEFLKPLLEGTRHIDPSHARYCPTGKLIAVVVADRDNMYAPNELGDDELGRLNMRRFLGKVAILEIATGKLKTIVDDSDGRRGPICWSPDGSEILFSRYLPKGDDREKTQREKVHGLAIWAIRLDGHGARMLTTGWSPDWR
jgi:Tol biopolymer transport system component